VSERLKWRLLASNKTNSNSFLAGESNDLTDSNSMNNLSAKNHLSDYRMGLNLYRLAKIILLTLGLFFFYKYSQNGRYHIQSNRLLDTSTGKVYQWSWEAKKWKSLGNISNAEVTNASGSIEDSDEDSE
ncbi:hypothetical protein, partial [Hymenobacter fastidiosus]|uniref:hypothetical protein n=1 Tax=Hymenobacter fastidiosus TaxID=486264 RepID=UPI0031E69191